jgi:hypothetical protein
MHIISEGNIGGVKNRVRAWIKNKAGGDSELEETLTDDIEKFWIMVPTPVKIHDAATVKALLEANPGPFGLVIIDTLFRAFTGNINDSSDMQPFIDAVDAIRDAAQCAVMIVHHEGKDASKGAMGSTALEGAVDAVARFKRVTDVARTFKITLAREAPEGRTIKFDLRSVVLEGATVAGVADTTSCFLVPTNLHAEADMETHERMALAIHWAGGTASAGQLVKALGFADYSGLTRPAKKLRELGWIGDTGYTLRSAGRTWCMGFDDADDDDA